MEMTLIISSDELICVAFGKRCREKRRMNGVIGRTEAETLLKEASATCEEAHAEDED